MLALLPKIKNFLNLESDSYDALLNSLLEAVISDAENYLSSPIIKKSFTSVYFYFASNILLKEIKPTVEKVEIVIQTGLKEIEFLQKKQILLILEPLQIGTMLIVSMNAGFEEVPEGLQHSLIKEVAYRFLESGQGESRLGKQSSSESAVSSSSSASYSPSLFFKELDKWKGYSE